MLTLITDGRRRSRFAQLAADAGKPVRHVVGFPGGSEEARVWVLRRHGFFWCQLAGDGHNRCWNGFGLVMPQARVLPLVSKSTFRGRA